MALRVKGMALRVGRSPGSDMIVLTLDDGRGLAFGPGALHLSGAARLPDWLAPLAAQLATGAGMICADALAPGDPARLWMEAARGLALAPGALAQARRRGLRTQALVSPADGAEAADLRRELGALWGLDAAGIPLLPEPPSPLTAASPPRVVLGTACRARLQAGDVALRDRLRSWCRDWPELTLLDPSTGQVTALAAWLAADPPAAERPAPEEDEDRPAPGP